MKFIFCKGSTALPDVVDLVEGILRLYNKTSNFFNFGIHDHEIDLSRLSRLWPVSGDRLNSPTDRSVFARYPCHCRLIATNKSRVDFVPVDLSFWPYWLHMVWELKQHSIQLADSAHRRRIDRNGKLSSQTERVGSIDVVCTFFCNNIAVNILQYFIFMICSLSFLMGQIWYASEVFA